MSTYYVRIPIAGSIVIQVDAASSTDAVAAAWEKVHENAGEPEDIGEVEWNYFERISTGNVSHVHHNEIEVTQ